MFKWTTVTKNQANRILFSPTVVTTTTSSPSFLALCFLSFLNHTHKHTQSTPTTPSSSSHHWNRHQSFLCVSLPAFGFKRLNQFLLRSPFAGFFITTLSLSPSLRILRRPSSSHSFHTQFTHTHTNNKPPQPHITHTTTLAAKTMARRYDSSTTTFSPEGKSSPALLSHKSSTHSHTHTYTHSHRTPPPGRVCHRGHQ